MSVIKVDYGEVGGGVKGILQSDVYAYSTSPYSMSWKPITDYWTLQTRGTTAQFACVHTEDMGNYFDEYDTSGSSSTPTRRAMSDRFTVASDGTITCNQTNGRYTIITYVKE